MWSSQIIRSWAAHLLLRQAFQSAVHDRDVQVGDQIELVPRMTAAPSHVLSRLNMMVFSCRMILFRELADSSAKHLFAEEDRFQKTFFLDASNKPLVVLIRGPVQKIPENKDP